MAESKINQKAIEYVLYISLLIPLGYLFIALSGGLVHKTVYSEIVYIVMIAVASAVIYSFKYAGIRSSLVLPFAIFSFLFGHFWFWFDPSADYEIGWLLVFPIAGFIFLGTFITGIIFGIALWRSKIKWSKLGIFAVILLFITNTLTIAFSVVLNFILAGVLEKKRAYLVYSIFLILFLSTAAYSYKTNGAVIDFSSEQVIERAEFSQTMPAAIQKAITTKDLSACITQYSSGGRNQGGRIQDCIRQAYPQINDPFACKNILDLSLKGMCAVTAANQNPDITVCDQITTYYPDGRIQCIMNVAARTNSPEICDLLSLNDKAMCLQYSGIS